MATCARCERSGFFLALNSSKLCTSCAQWLDYHATNLARIVRESVEIINTSKNLETRLSRCDTLLSLRAPLRELEALGRRIITDPPTVAQFMKTMEAQKSTLIENTLKREVEDAFAKSASLTSVNAKASALAKVSVRIESFLSHASAPASLPELKQKVQDAITEVRLDAHLEAARKAEFKGQKKKALDAYYEALYLLRHDEVDDALQADKIRPIEDKIRELGGTVS